jgi:hypothetical protein
MKNAVLWEVTFCGFVRTDVSGERSAPVIKVIRINKLRTELKNCVFWDVTPCASCNNRRFGRT